MNESPHNSPAEALPKAIFEKPEDENETSLDDDLYGDEEFAIRPPRTKALCGHKYCGERCMYMPKPGESTALMDTFIQLHNCLDLADFGDRLMVTRTNTSSTIKSTVIGPALADSSPTRVDPQGHQRLRDLRVGVDLLDGEPHIIRNDRGELSGNIIALDVIRDKVVIAAWRYDA